MGCWKSTPMSPSLNTPLTTFGMSIHGPRHTCLPWGEHWTEAVTRENKQKSKSSLRVFLRNLS